MPLRKQVPSIKSLCIENIVRNIFRHGESLKKYRDDKEVYRRYKTLQFLFTHELTTKFFDMVNLKCLDMNLKRLENFLFDSEEPELIEDWPCLEFFFNEHAVSICPALNSHYIELKNPSTWVENGIVWIWALRRKKMPDVVLSLITSKCKNIRMISQTFSFLMGKAITEIIPVFKNLSEVNLGIINTDEILNVVLKTCFGIRKLTADGSRNISDEFLLSFCNHSSEHGRFTFCPLDGYCSGEGKRLEILQVTLSHCFGEGIACALQHAPSLKNLAEPQLTYHSDHDFLPNISMGILILQYAAKASGRSPVALNLDTLHLHENLSPDQLQTVLESCSKLECVQIKMSAVSTKVFSMSSFINLKKLHLLSLSNGILNSLELKHLIFSLGERIQALSLCDSVEPLDSKYIIHILESCCNLKSFVLRAVKLYGADYDRSKSLPSCKTSLEKVSIEVYDALQSGQDYFRELLCKTTKLKHLEVGGIFATRDFPQILEKSDFSCLEEISISWMNLNPIPIQDLLKACRIVKRIEIFGHYDRDGLLQSCKEILKEENYDLEIVCS